MRILSAIALLVVLTTTACDYTEPRRIVAGVDLDALFAPAVASEVDAVRADWATRAPSAQSVRLEEITTRVVGDRTLQVLVVSHLVDGLRHVGAVVFPQDAAAGSLPVLMYLHGGDGGVSVDNEVLLVAGLVPGMVDGFVLVIPSFRDEPLRFGGRTWQSEGPASPWDRDVDDAMALLSVAFDVAPPADPDRVGAIGFSRGAGVGLLMAARDARVDRLIEFFGPTDFFGPFVQDVTEEILRGTPRDLPGLDYLSAEYLEPLAAGTVSMAEVRTQLVRRSAVLFVDAMPPVQLHHGTADAVVPVSQAQALIRAMSRAGRPETEFESYLYEGGEHNPLTLIGSIDRAVAFLAPLSNAS